MTEFSMEPDDEGYFRPILIAAFLGLIAASLLWGHSGPPAEKPHQDVTVKKE